MGPSTRPKPPAPEPTYTPHPDDADAVREGLEQAERGETLSAEESAAWLETMLRPDVK